MPRAEDAFAAVYSQYLPAIGGYLARRVEHRFVEDLAADVFAIAWSKRATVTPGEELPWLYRIAANLVANHRRRQATAVSLLFALGAIDTAPSAEDIAISDLALADAWGRLRPRDREVLALAVLEDLPIPTISTSLGVSANAVSIRLHRAKKTLARLLQEVDDTTDSGHPARIANGGASAGTGNGSGSGSGSGADPAIDAAPRTVDKNEKDESVDLERTGPEPT
jgi:RNA polymerase sigma-70 factor, ECF subfamily